MYNNLIKRMINVYYLQNKTKIYPFRSSCDVMKYINRRVNILFFFIVQTLLFKK